MTNMGESMKYERAYGALVGIIASVKSQRKATQEREAEYGDVKSDFFDMLISDLEGLKQRYRTLSDEAYNLHKAITPRIEPIGVQNLSNAIVYAAIEDYQEAISHKGDGAVGMRKAIRSFAEKEAGFYSSVDLPACLSRIDKAYQQFKKIATDNLEGIIATTKRIKAKPHGNMSFDENPYRCPLDGFGLYVKSKNRESGAVTIGCTHCNLEVEI